VNVPADRLRILGGPLELDGSHGEGGGQIVRTACALSALTGVSCRISNIRAGRKQPGLRPQHCTALSGLASLCGAETSPIQVGTTEVFFAPGALRAASLDLDTGTAGSVGLVLQSLLLAGMGLPGPWRAVIRGGTDVPASPSCDYVHNVKAVILARMGYRVGLRILRRGYYPKGGGIVQVQLDPPEGLLEGLDLPVATETTGSYGVSHASSGLSQRRVAERQRRQALRALTDLLHIPSKIAVEYGPTRSAGSGLVVWARTTDSVAGASSLGAPQKPAEQVADEAVEMLMRTYHTRASVDPWLGDQILPYMALSRGPTVISVPYLTRHMQTNMWVIQRFLNVRFGCEEQDQRIRIECRPRDSRP
jgi:RNA 3'-phosphate cyclase